MKELIHPIQEAADHYRQMEQSLTKQHLHMSAAEFAQKAIELDAVVSQLELLNIDTAITILREAQDRIDKVLKG